LRQESRGYVSRPHHGEAVSTASLCPLNQGSAHCEAPGNQMKKTKYRQQPPSLLIEEHGHKINACLLLDPADRVRETASACCKAQAAIRSPTAKRQLVDMLPFSRSVFSNYARIGGDR